jgi:hypothetical protein
MSLRRPRSSGDGESGRGLADPLSGRRGACGPLPEDEALARGLPTLGPLLLSIVP